MGNAVRLAIATLLLATGALATVAQAGPVADQYRGGAFGLAWNASPAAIEARYPGGKWDQDVAGHRQYCAANRQSLLKLTQQTRELCFVIGADGTLASVTATMDPTLAALLAVVNRSRTTFGDFDAVKRDRSAIQSAYTYMLWTRDAPYVVQVGSTNDSSGAPQHVSFTIADEAALHTDGAAAVSHKPALAQR